MRATTPSALLAALVTMAAGNSLPWQVLRQNLSDLGDVPRAASISADGRFVAFASSDRLLPKDVNDVADVYLFDRRDAALTLETASRDGGASDGASGSPRLDATGRFLVFDSDATNLTAGTDGNRARDIFVRDCVDGWTRRISVSASGREANHASVAPTISGNGRVVAFASHATNLTAGVDANGVGSDIYLVQLDTGAISRSSVGSDGRQSAAGESAEPALSFDGRVLTFMSSAPTAPSAARPVVASAPAVWVRDLTAGVTIGLCCRSTDRGFDPQLDATGRFVVFTAQRTGRRPDAQRSDIALVDRLTLATTVITRGANGSSGRPKLSGDGRFIVFQSQASNLECARRCSAAVADQNLLSDIYLFDRERGAFKRLSGDPLSWWAPSLEPAIDEHGSSVVFSSRQPLSAEDTTTAFDLFIWAREASGTAVPPVQR